MDEFGKKDLTGRMKVMWAIQSSYPNLIVASTEMKCRWDLEVWERGKEDHKVFLEIKDRDCPENQYNTCFLTPSKYDAASAQTTNWMYVNVFSDGKIDFWRPYAMPGSGMTVEDHYISPTTVSGGEKIRQRRYCLNFDDKYLQLHNEIEIVPRGK